jgi:CheY-like chemotaxis protein
VNGDRDNRHAHALDGLRLLIVEDDVDARDLLAHLLEQAGASIVTAGSAADALGMLDALRLDLLISDIGMPGQDGYEFIREVRSRGGVNASVPALAVTAYAGARDRERALAAGFRGHVGKPVKNEELIDAIRRAVGRM